MKEKTSSKEMPLVLKMCLYIAFLAGLAAVLFVLQSFAVGPQAYLVFIGFLAGMTLAGVRLRFIIPVLLVIALTPGCVIMRSTGHDLLYSSMLYNVYIYDGYTYDGNPLDGGKKVFIKGKTVEILGKEIYNDVVHTKETADNTAQQ